MADEESAPSCLSPRSYYRTRKKALPRNQGENSLKKFVLFILCFSILHLLCKHLTLDFDDQDLLPLCPLGSQEDTSHLPTDTPLSTMLDQPYYFFAKGNQAFVFLSEDGRYVLKLLKPGYPQCHFWGCSLSFAYIPLAKTIYKLCKQDCFQAKIHKDIQSYLNAFLCFKEQSKLEYLHLAKTSHLKTRLRLEDPLHNLRLFDADSTCFLVQKRVDPFFPTLENWIKQGDLDQAKRAIDEVIDLLADRFELGFVKSTHKFHRNFGFFESHPVQLDIGRLIMMKHSTDQPLTQTILQGQAEPLLHWLQKHYPSLSNHLLQKVQTRVATPKAKEH